MLWSDCHQQGAWEERISLFFTSPHSTQIELNYVTEYIKLLAKIEISKYRKHELCTEGETFINCSTVTTVIADTVTVLLIP
jgi:hypothetical protein